MFEKLKRYTHRIKRHKRNKKLSVFADKVLYVVRYCEYGNVTVFVHPLVYAIIRYKYPADIYLRLKEDCFTKDYFSLMTVLSKGEYYV